MEGASLPVTPGVANISPPPAIASYRPSSARKKVVRAVAPKVATPVANAPAFARPSKDAKKKTPTAKATGLMLLSPDLWTESKVTSHLSTNKSRPELVSILEMHVRMNASHKLLCRFKNAHESLCDVWIPDLWVFRYYPEEYHASKARFTQEVQR